jgi:hypothetical protein
MYASPGIALCLPPPRRRVTRRKFALAGKGRPLVMLLRGGYARKCAPVERGCPPELLLQSGDAASDAPAGNGRLMPSHTGEQCLSTCACGAGDAGENQFCAVKLRIQKIVAFLGTISTN